MSIFTSRSRGDIDASWTTVTTYLIDNYRKENGDDIRHADAVNLITAHEAQLNQGVRMGSFAYYVGDEIAKVEDLEYISEDEKPFPDDDDE